MRYCTSTIVFILALFALSPAPASTPPAYPLVSGERSLTTQFTFTATVRSAPVGDSGEALCLWMPIPSNGPSQAVSGLTVSAPGPYSIHKEKRFGDRMVYMRMEKPAYPVVVRVGVIIDRAEPRSPSDVNSDTAYDLPADISPDALVPVGGQYLTLANAASSGALGSVDRERDLFRSVISTMTYDYHKTSPRYAMGDSAFVCNYKSGNCTDLHSYLVSLTRSIKIPSVIEFGFPLTGIPVPDVVPTSGSIPGYHCWVWFKAGGRWLPEDAADARRWQDAGRSDVSDYLFGNLLLPRSAVAVSRGRDIVLSPAQHGPALNYFIYPYAEYGGQPTHAQWSVNYHILSDGTAGGG